MSSSSKLLTAALLLAASAAVLALPQPAAMADPLVYDPYQPGHHAGPPAYYHRYRVLAPDWFERRDSVTLHAGDSVAANQAIQMRDPWPPYVNNRHILFNGQVIDGAFDRYRTGAVTDPAAIQATVE